LFSTITDVCQVLGDIEIAQGLQRDTEKKENEVGHIPSFGIWYK